MSSGNDRTQKISDVEKVGRGAKSASSSPDSSKLVRNDDQTVPDREAEPSKTETQSKKEESPVQPSAVHVISSPAVKQQNKRHCDSIDKSDDMKRSKQVELQSIIDLTRIFDDDNVFSGPLELPYFVGLKTNMNKFLSIDEDDLINRFQKSYLIFRKVIFNFVIFLFVWV